MQKVHILYLQCIYWCINYLALYWDKSSLVQPTEILIFFKTTTKNKLKLLFFLIISGTRYGTWPSPKKYSKSAKRCAPLFILIRRYFLKVFLKRAWRTLTISWFRRGLKQGRLIHFFKKYFRLIRSRYLWIGSDESIALTSTAITSYIFTFGFILKYLNFMTLSQAILFRIVLFFFAFS